MLLRERDRERESERQTDRQRVKEREREREKGKVREGESPFTLRRNQAISLKFYIKGLYYKYFQPFILSSTTQKNKNSSYKKSILAKMFLTMLLNFCRFIVDYQPNNMALLAYRKKIPVIKINLHLVCLISQTDHKINVLYSKTYPGL